MRRNAYSPYPSIRGTNPSNAITFKVEGLPDRLTTNLVYTDTIILILVRVHRVLTRHTPSMDVLILIFVGRNATDVLGSVIPHLQPIQSERLEDDSDL